MKAIVCPFNRKYELVHWFNTHFNTRSGNRKSQKQLYAIWYKVARAKETKSKIPCPKVLTTYDEWEKELLKLDGGFSILLTSKGGITK
jgi:hypothetical protein|tara:strand:- start:1433 stop:1696 length:264 start_codon:yes stop_codon:yes gene_type:complete